MTYFEYQQRPIMTDYNTSFLNYNIVIDYDIIYDSDPYFNNFEDIEL